MLFISTMDKMRIRSVCFKADAPNPNDPSQISPVEYAQTAAAIRNFNQYKKDKPLLDAYSADIVTGQPKAVRDLRGQVNADLAQKQTAQMSNINPNMGMPSFSKGAVTASKIIGDVGRDSMAQKGMAINGIVNSKLGLQGNVNTAQEGLAKDAVDRNLTDISNSINSKNATSSAAASLLGSGSSMLYNKKKEV